MSTDIAWYSRDCRAQRRRYFTWIKGPSWEYFIWL